MAQNTSSAVMQQRNEANDSLDYFPTPPWATRALCEKLNVFSPLHLLNAWEPACGGGHMARPLGEYFDRVYATDVHDYSDMFAGQDAVCDFLNEGAYPSFVRPEGSQGNVDWVITNPPFRMGQEFVANALSCSVVGVGMFVRSAFLEGRARFETLFEPMPPAIVFQFVERVPLVKGRVDKSAASATSYSWIVWLNDHPGGTAFKWIEPCRARLEQGADYPDETSSEVQVSLFQGNDSSGLSVENEND